MEWDLTGQMVPMGAMLLKQQRPVEVMEQMPRVSVLHVIPIIYLEEQVEPMLLLLPVETGGMVEVWIPSVAEEPVSFSEIARLPADSTGMMERGILPVLVWEVKVVSPAIVGFQAIQERQRMGTGGPSQPLTDISQEITGSPPLLEMARWEHMAAAVEAVAVPAAATTVLMTRVPVVAVVEVEEFAPRLRGLADNMAGIVTVFLLSVL